MTDLSALQQRATALGRPFPQVARRHVLDGLLRRLAHSAQAGAFLLRGGLLTRVWVGDERRWTDDVDFLGLFERDVDGCVQRLSEALSTPLAVADGVHFHVDTLAGQVIWMETSFPGVRLALLAEGAGLEHALQIDVGFGDPVVPPATWVDCPTLLPGSPARVLACRPETLTGWKLHGLFEHGAKRWRAKDLFDLWLLTQLVPQDRADQTEAVRVAFASRDAPLEQIPDVLYSRAWWDAPKQRQRWEKFVPSVQGSGVPAELLTVVGVVARALRPALVPLVELPDSPGSPQTPGASPRRPTRRRMNASPPPQVRTTMTTLLLRNGRVIDPSQGIDQVADLWISGDRVAALGPRPDIRADRTLDATGRIVCPGLIDMHVHLREPGREEDETIATGTAAALAGGVTSVACMPNTEPPIDSQAAAEFVHLQAQRAGNANVFPVGSITKERRGTELAEIGGLVEGGAVAFTDDGSPVVSSEIMRRAMEYCKMFDKAVLSHSEDIELSRNAVMNEGFESTRLGLRGYPAVAEEIMVFREIALAELTGARVHILHVSTAGSVELIRRGKERGVRVTGEACPHHFTLTDKCLRTFDSNYKMSPPLRTERDVEAILAGLRDGTLEVIATDHAPHAPEKKMRELDQAPNGIIGLETLLPVCIKALIEPGRLTWPQLIEKLTANPARVLGIDRGTLKVGAVADVTVIDPLVEWTIDPGQFRSKSRNCPFAGWEVRGRAETVIVGGVVKYERAG